MKKRILIVYAKSTQELMNRQSALGSYIFCLCELIEKNGSSVFVNGIAFEQIKLQAGKTIVNNQTQTSGKLRKYIPSFIKIALKDLMLFKQIKQTVQQSSSRNYDYVLEFYTYASTIGYKIASRQNIPLLLIYDSPVLEEYVFFHGRKLFFKKRILTRELKTLLKAETIVVYSNAVKKYLNKLTRKDLNIRIHQNVDFTRFDFLEKKFDAPVLNIGFLGSFLKWHRIDLLIDVFQRLKEENEAVDLFLIGNGMEYDSIKSLVEKSGYKQSITMTGFLDGSALVEMKKKMHIGVMPGSNWYGAPNKIFEYGAAKMAVVAPSTPTIADLFKHEQDLLLFKQDDAEDLYQKLKHLCKNREEIARLANVLQDKIKNTYSEENTSGFYNQLFV